MKRLPFLLAATLAVALPAPVVRAEDPPPASPTPPPPPAPEKPDEKPAPDAPAPAPKPEGEKPDPEKPAPAKPAKPEKPAAPPPPVLPPNVGPPGMVHVPADYTEMRIGTSAKELVALTKMRPDAEAQLKYETPSHLVGLKPFFIGAYEVSNAQYLLFMEKTAQTKFKTGSSAASSLEKIASLFLHGDAESPEGAKDNITWGQLYELNKDALHAAKPELLKDKDGKDLPPKEVKRQFRWAALPEDVELIVSRRRMPEDWFMTSNRLEDPAGPDLPVRDVSYLDALAFSKWAGFHVPTEQEWEVAARGPTGNLYPWGDEWIEEMTPNGVRTIETRCNWADMKVVNRLFDPSAMPVDTLPEGKSWCGCHHMLGNVAEWTSSWFDLYPGFIPPAPPKKNNKNAPVERPNPWESYPGEYVKVIRGASVADRERLVLRLAARNFMGAGSTAPPLPENHFKYVGFRCASYFFQPGLDRYEAALLPLLKGKKITRDGLVPERFAGAMAVKWVPRGTAVENHVYVTDASHAILFAPVRQLYPSDEQPPSRTPAEILAETKAAEDDPLILGFFSTDVGIVGLVKDPKAPPPPPAPSGVRRGKKPKVAEGPRVVKGTIPPGSYILGLNHGAIGLYKGNLDFVGWVGNGNATPPVLDAPKIPSKATPPDSSLSADPEIDFVKCSLWIPLGGKGTEANQGITFKFSCPTESGALDKAGSWREGHGSSAPPAPP